MKNFNTYINEKLIISKNKLKSKYKYHPKNKKELKDVIINHIMNDKYDLNHIDTSAITDMSFLFQKISVWDNELYDINISEWNVSNVTTMEGMFLGCKKCNPDLTGWDVSNVTNMDSMFAGCENFEGKGLETWDVSNVTNITYMFYGDLKFIEDISNWDVSNVKNAVGVFTQCMCLTTDFSKWDYSSFENATDMFNNCISMKWDARKINFKPIIDKTNKNNFEDMFYKTKIITPDWYIED